MNSTKELASRITLLKAVLHKTAGWKINGSLGQNWLFFLSMSDYSKISWASSKDFTVPTDNIIPLWLNTHCDLKRPDSKPGKKLWVHLSIKQVFTRLFRVRGKGESASCVTGHFQGVQKNGAGKSQNACIIVGREHRPYYLLPALIWNWGHQLKTNKLAILYKVEKMYCRKWNLNGIEHLTPDQKGKTKL